MGRVFGEALQGTACIKGVLPQIYTSAQSISNWKKNKVYPLVPLKASRKRKKKKEPMTAQQQLNSGVTHF